MKNLYIDLDGVICDFEKSYTKLFGKTPKQARDFKEFSPNWTTFVEGGHFSNLDKFPGADLILKIADTLSKKGVNVEILSSSGGKKYHDLVMKQKLEWLKKNNINYKANIVAGRRLKSDFANNDSVLIDDTDDVIESFNEAGGFGILHNDVNKTLQMLEILFSKTLNT